MLASALVRDRKSMDYGRKETRMTTHTAVVFKFATLCARCSVKKEKLILISYSQRRSSKKCTWQQNEFEVFIQAEFN
jgi:hypothetical protein